MIDRWAAVKKGESKYMWVIIIEGVKIYRFCFNFNSTKGVNI